MTTIRKQFEIAILNQYFTHRFAFFEKESRKWLEVGLRSNQGLVYKLVIEISQNYPYQMPMATITFPKLLKGFNGKKINSYSHELHTLECTKEYIGLCLFHPNQWSPNQSLYKVIVKAKLWIEAYENYLKTGKNINTYLKC
jgi:hypothetical protein